MTVQELIQQLEQFSPAARLIVDGYESGFDEATHADQIFVEPHPNREWWEGQFDKSENVNAETVVRVYSIHRMKDE